MVKKIENFLKNAKTEIVIIGINSLDPYLEKSAKFFYNLLNIHNDLKVSIYYESESENFNQSLTVDTKESINRISFTALETHKDRIVGTTDNSGLKNRILDFFDKRELKEKLTERILLGQINFRLPINIIKADEEYWFCFVSNKMPQIDDYQFVTSDSMKADIKNYIEFYTKNPIGKVHLSNPDDELIQMYDSEKIPRGIFPRKAFYLPDRKRYSIWGFVFNRKGELLLHQRSKHTKDNRLMWDKSIGGHVDITDASTYITAQRELIEEMFMPQAEFTPFLKEDVAKFSNFGDLNFKKRPESEFKLAFNTLATTEWIMFRATDKKGVPLTVDRKSPRKINISDNKTIIKKTNFISDVYLFIAPENYIDTNEQMKDLVELSEKTGAAQDHKLVSIDELRDWIEEEEKKNNAENIFTDDLLYINSEMRNLLERFAELIKYVF